MDDRDLENRMAECSWAQRIKLLNVGYKVESYIETEEAGKSLKKSDAVAWIYLTLSSDQALQLAAENEE